MAEHETFSDAQTYPRQIGRHIAAALLDGRAPIARMYWDSIGPAEQAIAAAEVALAWMGRGIVPPTPTAIAHIIDEERASLELTIGDGSVWRRTPSGWYMVAVPPALDSPALRAAVRRREDNAAMVWARGEAA